MQHDVVAQLVGSPTTTCAAVFEANRPVHGSPLVAFGCATFVTESFAADTVTYPTPGLNSRILQAMLDGKSPILTPEALRHDNTIPGLNLITLAGYIRPACEDDLELMREISMTISKAFYQQYIGFRLRRFLFEVTTQALRQRPHKLSIYPFHSYPQPTPASAPLGAVMLDRNTALQREDSPFAWLFRYREPILRFTPGEQEILQVALPGHPNPGQADVLGLGREAVRGRWRTVLDRAAPLLQEIMRASKAATAASKVPVNNGTPSQKGVQRVSALPPRGKQRRQYVINYVREHPEELRPFDWQLWDSVHGGAGK
jgi:hypothetical protein